METELNTYVKAYGVFKCPSNPQGSNNNNDNPANTPAGAGFVRSYGANENRGGTGQSANTDGVGGPFGDTNSTGVPLAQITSPSNVIELAESTAAYSDFNVSNSSVFTSSTYCLFSGHTSLSNYLFCDGHVKSLRPFQTTDAVSGGSAQVNMWTVDNSDFSNTHYNDATNVNTVLAYSANLYK